MYDAVAAFTGLELRHYDLQPENGWEVDFKSVEALVDNNTVAIVIINPGNPCGSVYTYQHLQKVSFSYKTQCHLYTILDVLILYLLPLLHEKFLCLSDTKKSLKVSKSMSE